MPFDLGVLGNMTPASDLTKATLTMLQLWLPAAITAVNNTGYGLPDEQFVGVMTWGRVPAAVVSEVADQVPAVYVSSNGTTGKPIQIGHAASYSSWFDLRVMVVDRAMDWETTAERVQIWAAMIRQTVLQHQSMGGISQKIEFTAESYGEIASDEGRTFAGALVTFRVLLAPISERGDVGPATPLPVVDPETGLAATLPDGPVATSFEGVFNA